MRSPTDHFSAALCRGLLTVLPALALAGCGVVGGGSHDGALASLPSASALAGAGADYPQVLGAPYTVAGVEYVPAETMNVDEVGFVPADDGAMGYTAAHHTLPLPSYVEVTSLETGRTVLVRVERRGPMDTTDVLALSPAAMAQLGGDAGQTLAGQAVRVRRVNPPEEQRALLRQGQAAPLRMDTPAALLTVLQRRLPARTVAGQSPALPRTIQAVEVAASTVSVPVPEARSEEPLPAEPPVSEAVAVAEPAPAAAGRFSVQAAAFANPDNARRAASALGGSVIRSGALHRVRTGPFATRGEAEASLANVRRAGYSDARILTGG